MYMMETKETYNDLLCILGYDNNPRYKNDQDGIYDGCFFIEIDEKEYPIVGIKCMDEVDDEKIMKQHIIFWNRNDVPISILVFPSEYRIYNNFLLNMDKCFLYDSNSSEKNSDILSSLSAKKIANKFILEKIIKLSEPSNRVDKRLLNSLKNTVNTVYEKNNMDLNKAYNFMSMCILVKYLEDREMLTSNFFEKWNVDCFTNFLEKKCIEHIYEFFMTLKQRFNGDLFKLNYDEIPTINQLEIFYRFFRGDEVYNNGYTQLRFFPYDFSVIPISLISNIYETFISMDDEKNKEKKAASAGAFYTPEYLADFIVYNTFFEKCNFKTVPKVLDPACGSGVFLVNAYKNQIKILKKEKDFVSPDSLCNILTSKIYGVDINEAALKISCFSLYIALLDELMPKDIIENKFRFPNLIGKNLIHTSFFSKTTEDKLKNLKFDIIIGNPPWKSMPYSDHVKYCKINSIPNSDAQIAQAFMCRVKDFVNENCRITFVITNTVFTNTHSRQFLRFFLNNFTIEYILNLERIKTQLFSHASYPCSIVTYNCKEQKNYILNYCTFESNVLFKLLNKIVYDKNNEIKIKKSMLLDNEYLWRLLVYGDEFDAECIKELKRFPELGESIKELDFVQGYVTASTGEICENFFGYKGGSLKGYFEPFGIDYDNIPEISHDLKYDRTRDMSIYTCANKLLVKRTYNEKSWGAAYITEPLVFSNDFSSFNDYSGNNIGCLKYLEGILNSKVFQYYIYYVSKVKVAKKPEVVKEDIIHFPMPIYDYNNKLIKNIIGVVEKIEKETKNKINNIMCFSNNIKELKQQLDKMIFELYQLDEFQQSIVIEGIEKFVKKEINNNYAEKQDYCQFSDYLVDYFNYYMSNEFEKKWKYKYIESDLYTMIKFYFGNEIYTNKDIIDMIGILGVNKINEQFLIQKQIIMFDHTGFQIIQGKDKKNWSVRRAIRLAAKITKEIIQSEGKSNE